MKRVLALLLCLFSFSALADSYPSGKEYNCIGAIWDSSQAGACSALAAWNTANAGGIYTVTGQRQGTGATWFCDMHKTWGPNNEYSGNAGGTCTSRASCPNGGALSADNKTCTKTCDPGLSLMADGSCKKDCTGKLGQPTPSPFNEFANDGGSPTIGGCEVNCGTWAAPKGSTVLLPAYQVGSNCKFTGKAPFGAGSEGTGFKPDPEAPKKPSDCTGAGMGYVQGSTGTTCVPPSDAPDTAPKTNEKKESVTGPPDKNGNPDPTNPDTATTTKESSTDPATGKTIEKTTTTQPPSVDPNGVKICPPDMALVGDLCTKSSSTVKDTPDFCAANPTAAACGGKANSDACTDNPDRASCANMGDPNQGDSSALPTKDAGVSSISPVSLNTDMSCPTGAAMPFGIGTFPMDGICMFASGIRPIIIVMAWVAAALIVIGAFRGDS